MSYDFKVHIFEIIVSAKYTYTIGVVSVMPSVNKTASVVQRKHTNLCDKWVSYLDPGTVYQAPSKQFDMMTSIKCLRILLKFVQKNGTVLNAQK